MTTTRSRFETRTRHAFGFSFVHLPHLFGQLQDAITVIPLSPSPSHPYTNSSPSPSTRGLFRLLLLARLRTRQLRASCLQATIPEPTIMVATVNSSHSISFKFTPQPNHGRISPPINSPITPYNVGEWIVFHQTTSQPDIDYLEAECGISEVGGQQHIKFSARFTLEVHRTTYRPGEIRAVTLGTRAGQLPWIIKQNIKIPQRRRTNSMTATIELFDFQKILTTHPLSYLCPTIVELSSSTSGSHCMPFWRVLCRSCPWVVTTKLCPTHPTLQMFDSYSQTDVSFGRPRFYSLVHPVLPKHVQLFSRIKSQINRW